MTRPMRWRRKAMSRPAAPADVTRFVADLLGSPPKSETPMKIFHRV